MTGNINLNNNDITGIPNTPPTNSSAISKNYLDMFLIHLLKILT